MLNNTGAAHNEGFSYSSQFGQPLPSQLAAGQAVFGNHAGHKVLAGGRMANMPGAAQQQAAQQQQRQRMNAPPTSAQIQLQQQQAQQHFAAGQYVASSQQQQQRAAAPQHPLLGALGPQLGKFGNLAPAGAGFPALAQAQQAGNAARPAGVNLAAQYARNDRGNLEPYLMQQTQQGLGGAMPGQRGGLGQLDAAGRAQASAAASVLHGAGQLGKGPGANGISMAPGAAHAVGKLDRMSAFPQGLQHPALAGMTAPKQDGLAPGAPKPGTGASFLADHDTVFDHSDFPALGMGLAPDAAPNATMSAMLGNVQHIFNDAQFGNLAMPGSPAKPLGARNALDHSDFPALGGGNQAGHNVAGLPAAAQRGAPAHMAGAAAADAALQADKAAAAAAAAAKPVESPQEAFGLLGLLSVIRMTDPDVTTLALGLDLQTLGLNLNAPESLHRTFSSPWSDESRPAAMDQHLPSCYLFPPQKLDAQCMGRFTLLSVLFIFYARAGEEQQLLAAEELCKRGWHFHKVHQVWCQAVPGKVQQCTLNGTTGEKGHFKVFDVQSWSIQDKEDLFIDWKQCEDPPWRERAAGHPHAQQTDGLGGVDALKELKPLAGNNGHANAMQRYQ